MEDIIQAGQVDIQNKLQQCINQSEMIKWEREQGEIYIPVEVTKRGLDLVKHHVAQIVSWIGYHKKGEDAGWVGGTIYIIPSAEETRRRHEWDTTKKQSIDQIDNLIKY